MFTIEAGILKKAVKAVMPAVGKHNLPTHACSLVRLEAAGNGVRLTGTDLQTMIDVWVDCEVSEPFTALVPPKILRDFAFEGGVTISQWFTEGVTFWDRNGLGELALDRLGDHEDFPAIPETRAFGSVEGSLDKALKQLDCCPTEKAKIMGSSKPKKGNAYCPVKSDTWNGVQFRTDWGSVEILTYVPDELRGKGQVATEKLKFKKGETYLMMKTDRTDAQGEPIFEPTLTKGFFVYLSELEIEAFVDQRERGVRGRLRKTWYVSEVSTGMSIDGSGSNKQKAVEDGLERCRRVGKETLHKVLNGATKISDRLEERKAA